MLLMPPETGSHTTQPGGSELSRGKPRKVPGRDPRAEGRAAGGSPGRWEPRYARHVMTLLRKPHVRTETWPAACARLVRAAGLTRRTQTEGGRGAGSEGRLGAPTPQFRGWAGPGPRNL